MPNQSSMTPGIDPAVIRRNTWIQHVEYHPRLESTNLTAAELLEPLLEHSPAVVVTDEQTAGRGRKGNRWWSSSGALTFSIVMDAAAIPLAPERRGLISLVSGMAVRDAVGSVLEENSARIKWPNDLLVRGLKVSGILTEQRSTMSQRQGLIVGIGLNVNNSMMNAPEEVRERSTSLFDLAQKSFDLTMVLTEILNAFDRRTQQLLNQPMMFLSDLNSVHELHHRMVTVQHGEICHSGRCEGIDDEGNLVLVCHSQMVRLSSGVVINWE
ncbi:MAG: biotin--[acetyl-CoA-carboxylase] ligase [Planctomyces sp.]